MSQSPDLISARRITIYCPIAPATVAAIARGDPTALLHDPRAAGVLALIERSPDLGNFGRYKGVYEIGFGAEAFTPEPDARPTVGAAGKRTLSPTAAITTYVPSAISTARLVAWLAAVADAHPWEVPVIDVIEIQLFLSAQSESV